jgi:prephenate dehydrogenase
MCHTIVFSIIYPVAYFCKYLHMRDLRQIAAIGLGLLGGSITLRLLRSLPGITTIGYTHRPATLAKARQLAVPAEIAGDINQSVSGADLVILATLIYTFEKIFSEIGSMRQEKNAVQ